MPPQKKDFYDRTMHCISEYVNYQIRDYRAFTQCRTGSWYLNSTYMYNIHIVESSPKIRLFYANFFI